ncbi:hypothetical protein GCM10009578_092750 [Streptomyces rhizosphaericus]
MSTLTHSGKETLPALREACLRAGFDAAQAHLIRALDNGIWRLPGGVVARVHQPGTAATARREIRGTYWLYGNGVPVPLAPPGPGGTHSVRAALPHRPSSPQASRWATTAV